MPPDSYYHSLSNEKRIFDGVVLGKMFIISLFICSRFSRQKEMESLVLSGRLLAVTTAAAEGQWAVRVPLSSTPDLESVHQHFLSGGERKPSS